MRAVIQRVTRARVSAGGRDIGAIGGGLLILLAVAHDDDEATARRLAAKCADMRLFPAGEGSFERSLSDTGGEALVVSQFTLLVGVRKGRRPSFEAAARPEAAAPLVDAFISALRARGVTVAAGEFGAMMQIELVNDGPVTLVLDSADLEGPRRG